MPLFIVPVRPSWKLPPVYSPSLLSSINVMACGPLFLMWGPGFDFPFPEIHFRIHLTAFYLFIYLKEH